MSGFPIKKLSGLTSLCIIYFECIYSNLSNICIPIIQLSFKENFLFLLINILFIDFPNNV